MFTSTRGQGFHVAFANGWRVSVQWGPGNYCQNKAMTDAEVEAVPFPGLQSTNAEVLVISGVGKYEPVKGWMSPEDVAALLARVAKRKPL